MPAAVATDGRTPGLMQGCRAEIWALLLLCAFAPGCASMRRNAPSPDLRPCTDGYAYTRDGWRLGVRHYRPAHPDPGKLPVILCHGLGLNATFWTITDNHLPAQLTQRGYEVYVFDIRASGENARLGKCDRVNQWLRETPFREKGESSWNVDDLVRYDVPAILDYVEKETGQSRVNWVGHSLGGMMMFPFLELSTEPERIANFVGLGSTIIQSTTPQRDMLHANFGIRSLLHVASAGRLGRPLTYFRMPGLEMIDQFYYTTENVDRRTISRFYGYTLEDPGPGALRQFAPYLRNGHLLSADGRIDYSARLGEITVPALMVAGARDLISDVPSTRKTFDSLGSADKTLVIFGKSNGHIADYGHCDLAWSRYAPKEIFPVMIEWLDRRQPGVGPSPQSPARSIPLSPSSQEGFDANL
jgi:pimeloyl-ACP methyl ester carboxylesterase